MAWHIKTAKTNVNEVKERKGEKKPSEESLTYANECNRKEIYCFEIDKERPRAAYNTIAPLYL